METVSFIIITVGWLCNLYYFIYYLEEGCTMTVFRVIGIALPWLGALLGYVYLVKDINESKGN